MRPQTCQQTLNPQALDILSLHQEIHSLILQISYKNPTHWLLGKLDYTADLKVDFPYYHCFAPSPLVSRTFKLTHIKGCYDENI